MEVPEWIEFLLKSLNSQDQGLLCNCLLSIWTSRNHLIFENIEESSMEAVDRTRRKHEEFLFALRITDAEIQSPPPDSNSSERWNCPPTNTIKINVDASTSENGLVGIGIVARDNFGAILMASTWKGDLSLNSQEAEALACLMGLEKAQQCCFFDVIVENDNIEVIQSLRLNKRQNNYFESFIVDCFNLVTSLRSVKFSHVKRSGNRVAHELAKIALTNPNEVWMEDAPSNICNLAFLDIISPIHE
ncbi:uncharacterized protein LOC130934843 [Arachis stenosperma]|uniref:uncharacterized protein LOC130934843 n=1 Tax=Arachis stenosperma TaxID=217475 RepID=UPI0025ACC68D|nr:uncharacterized protein LOC130934843 [Arachis stenosperma]